MIQMIFTALGLDMLLQAHSRGMSVILLENKNRSGEYRKDSL